MSVGTKIYYHYSVFDQDDYMGYLIVGENQGVVEFSGDKSYFYEYFNNENSKEFDGKICYYEPGFHEIVDNYDYYARFQGQTRNSFVVDEVNPVVASSSQYGMITGVPDYNNTYGCIPTAIGNVLGYWDSHGYPNLVTGTSAQLISTIRAWMNNPSANSEIPTAVHGYCHTVQRYPQNFTATNVWNPTFSMFRSEIDSGHPTLVGFSSAGYYGAAHMTTGVGYFYDMSSTNRYIYVHDGWTTTSVDFYVQWTTANDFICRIVP